MRNPMLTLAAFSLAASALMGCEAMPRDQFVQWVARDAWSSTCAEKAMVESWTIENRRWKMKGEALLVDIKMTFKLTDDCAGMKAFESKKFEVKGFEVSKCSVGKATGWSLPGKERSRCWTGPRLFAGQAEPSPSASAPASPSGSAPASPSGSATKPPASSGVAAEVSPEEAAAVAAPGTPAAAPAAAAAAAAAAPGMP